MTRPAIHISEIRLGDAEVQAVAEVIRSGNLREGPKARAFEAGFSQATGASHSIAASSGTAALHLAYLALLNPGDEVLVPSFTFIATASMVSMAGAVPVFCDIDPETWTLCPKDVERKLTSKTRGIAGVHFFGNACDIGALEQIAKKRQLKVIWDAAQALGTQYQNKDIALFGDATCFSFYPTKNMTTGEGGMITTANAELAGKIKLLKSHGQQAKYIHEVIGLNYRISEMEAAIGIIQLEKLDSFLAARQKVAKQYTEFFNTIPEIKIQKVTPGSSHSFNYFSIVLVPEKVAISRDELIKELAAEGIPTAIHYPRPLHLQPCFSGAPNAQKGALPASEFLAENIIALPMHAFLTEEAVSYITQTIKNKLKLKAVSHK